MKIVFKLISYLILALLLIVVLLLSTLPLTVPSLAKNIAEDFGIALSIEKLSINWGQGLVSVAGIAANAIEVPAAPVNIKLLELDLSLTQLFKNKQVFIDGALLRGVDVPLQLEFAEGQEIQRILIAGIDPEQFGSDTPEENSSDKEELPETKSTAFIGWSNIQIKDVVIDAQLIRRFDGQLDGRPEKYVFPVELSQFEVDEFYLTNTDAPIVFGAELAVNQSKLNFSGDVAVLAPGKEGHLATTISDVDLKIWSEAAEFLQVDLAPLVESAGALALTTNVKWWLAGDRNFVTLEATEFTASNTAITTVGGADSAMNYSGEAKVRVETLKLQTNPVHYEATNIEFNSENLSFKNASLDPPFAIALKNFSLNVDAIDSKNTNTESVLQLKTDVERYGKLALNASGAFLDEQPNGKITLNSEQINLPAFSGLAKNALGKHIDKGALDFNFDASIENGQLDSKAEIEAHQLGLSGDFGSQSNVVEELGMPINAALNLLRDKDDTVRLTVPITGDLRDPKIKISNVVNKALMNGVKTAVFTQFGPLMALSALDKARSMADALKLKPVEFQALKFELEEADKQTLENLSVITRLLDSRPKIKLNVCGFSSLLEVQSREFVAGQEKPSGNSEQQVPELNEEQKQQLYELANLRAEYIKDYLMQSGIEGKRLILCAPTISENAETPPKVEFSL